VRAESVRGHPVDVHVDQHRPHDQLDVDHSDHELDVDHPHDQLDVDHSDHELDVDHPHDELHIDHPDHELDVDHPHHELDVAAGDDLEHVDDRDAHHEHDLHHHRWCDCLRIHVHRGQRPLWQHVPRPRGHDSVEEAHLRQPLDRRRLLAGAR